MEDEIEDEIVVVGMEDEIEELPERQTEPVVVRRNRARCKKCNDVIESVHRHDFKWCMCRAIFVDGGSAYHRRGGCLDDIEEMP